LAPLSAPPKQQSNCHWQSCGHRQQQLRQYWWFIAQTADHEYTPLAELSTPASSNRGSIVGLIICAAENSRELPLAELRHQQQLRQYCGLHYAKPPTTDEYTPLAELLTPPVANGSIVGPYKPPKTAENSTGNVLYRRQQSRVAGNVVTAANRQLSASWLH
jgi:hypothetical protein